MANSGTFAPTYTSIDPQGLDGDNGDKYRADKAYYFQVRDTSYENIDVTGVINGTVAAVHDFDIVKFVVLTDGTRIYFPVNEAE